MRFSISLISWKKRATRRTLKLPMGRVLVVGIVDGAMVADGQKMVARRCSKLERKLRRGLKVLVKDGGIVEIAADVTGTGTVGIVDAVMAGSGSRRVSLWHRWQRVWTRVLPVRRAKAMRLVKVLPAPMADAGGVDVVDGVVAVAAVRMDRRWRVRVLPLLRLTMSLWRSLRVSARLLLVSRVADVIVIVVGASAVDVTADGWMRFVSGLHRGGIAVRRRMRMRPWTLRLRDRRLSR